MGLVNYMLVLLQSDAAFDKIWNQLLYEVSQLNIEKPELPPRRKMHKRVDEAAPHHFCKTWRDLYRRT